MGHTCHWPGCAVEVPPKLFACRKHWFTLPKGLRSAIWQEFRPGQEQDKNPSRAYLAVVEKVMKWIREYEQRQQAPAPVPDARQRYEVRAIDGHGKEIVVGWCNNNEGKPLSTCVERHPIWHSPKVIDRDTGEIVHG